MSDELREWMLSDEDEPSDDALAPEPLLEDEAEARPTARKRPRPQLQISPAAFFVFSMMLFFVVCLLSLVILLVTGRIFPA